MIKVLIADDHPIVRQGLKQIVTKTFDMVVGGEAHNGQEVLDKVLTEDFDVIVLDITMPDRSGLDALRTLRCERPTLPVLMLSMHPEGQYAVRVLKAGAAGYMTKESAPAELVKAIRKVCDGGKYVSSSMAEQLASALGGRDNPPHNTLSDREYQVMCLIVKGFTVTEIAEQLKLSVKTISTYRTRVLKKLNLKNNIELTHYAIRNRLVD